LHTSTHHVVMQRTTSIANRDSCMSMMSVRLPDDLTTALADLATATGRTKSYLAIEALREYAERETWQVAKIKKVLSRLTQGNSPPTKRWPL
jgi:RHH-type rel operon transcriptional repressor/antitoxin RelB